MIFAMKCFRVFTSIELSLAAHEDGNFVHEAVTTSFNDRQW